MKKKISLIVPGLLVVILIAILSINRNRLQKTNARLKKALLAESKPVGGSFNLSHLERLPAPVQRYLTRVIPEGHPLIDSVRLVQTGKFRLGDRTSPWKPLDAEQHFTVNPPGFVWDATIQMAPMMPVRVVDMYKSGQGFLRAKLLSTLTVADSQGKPEIDSAELMRYLTESVWFPTALLPGQGTEWSPINDRSAMASITYGDTNASVVFFFNDRDEVERIHSKGRFREVDGRYELTPWTGYWYNYQSRDGLLIPLEGKVEWNLSDGDLVYRQAEIGKIEYRVSE